MQHWYSVHHCIVLLDVCVPATNQCCHQLFKPTVLGLDSHWEFRSSIFFGLLDSHSHAIRGNYLWSYSVPPSPPFKHLTLHTLSMGYTKGFSSNTVLTSSLRSISEGTQLVLTLVLYRSMSVEHEVSVINSSTPYFLFISVHTSNPIPNLNTVPSLKPKSKKLKFQLSLPTLSVVCTSCVWV